MKFSEICEKIKSGEFTIDLCGHQNTRSRENILRWYEDCVANANGANDNKWASMKSGKAEDPEKVNADMRRDYQRDLDRDYKIADLNETDGRKIDCTFFCEGYCFCCGERLFYTFNGKGLSLNVCHKRKDDDISVSGDSNSRFGFYNCGYSKLEPLKVEIDVSDQLVFANWFPCHPESAPEEQRYSNAYSLNSSRGIRNTGIWKAKNQNIAYSQVDSCGATSIWMNKDRTHGYITRGYVGEDGDDDIQFLNGYEKVGRTDVSCWRVEMADSAKVDMDKVKEKWQVDGAYPDAAIVKVPTGKWSMTTHYDVPHSLSGSILAEIKFLGNI